MSTFTSVKNHFQKIGRLSYLLPTSATVVKASEVGMHHFFLGPQSQFLNLKEALPQSQFHNFLKNVGLQLQFRSSAIVYM
jgi:hypothetical protein